MKYSMSVEIGDYKTNNTNKQTKPQITSHPYTLKWLKNVMVKSSLCVS
jgi:hypothetical protein